MSDNRELTAYLNGLSKKIRGRLATAIKTEAEALSRAQRLALVSRMSPPEESGALEASCRVIPGRNDLEHIVVAGGQSTTVEVRSGSGADFDYAVAFEYGTKHQRARPFFYSTYRTRERGIRERVERAVSEALK